MKDISALSQRKAYSSDLSAHDWQRLEPVLLAPVRRRSKWPLLELVNAILYVLKNGCLWREVPGEFPPWGTGYWYFSKWQDEGVLDKINPCLVADCREHAQKKPSPVAS